MEEGIDGGPKASCKLRARFLTGVTASRRSHRFQFVCVNLLKHVVAQHRSYFLRIMVFPQTFLHREKLNHFANSVDPLIFLGEPFKTKGEISLARESSS